MCYDENPSPSITFEGEIRIDGACEHDYTLFRTWTATDCAGYSRSREQIITVQDTESPVLFVPQDLTVLCQDLETADLGFAYGTDACGEVTVTFEEEVIAGECPGSFTILRSFNATDPCLNTATGLQTIHVIDTVAPVIQEMPHLVLSCEQEIPSDLPIVTDNCSGVDVSVTENFIFGSCPHSYGI